MNSPLNPNSLLPLKITLDSHLTITGIENYSPDLLFQHSKERLIGSNINRPETNIGLEFSNELICVTENIRKAQTEKRNVYFEYPLGKNKETADYAVGYAQNNDDGTVFCHVFRVDANDIKQARNQISSPPLENELLKTYGNLRQFMHVAKVNMWFYDLKTDSYYTVRNNKFEKTHVNYHYVLNKLHPDDRDNFVKTVDKMRQGISKYAEIELRVFNDTEMQYRYYDCTLEACQDESGEITHITGSERDITENKRRENEVAHTFKSLNLAMESASITTWDYDISTRKSRILYGNCTPELNRLVQQLTAPEPNTVCRDHISLFLSGKKQIETWVVQDRTEQNDPCYYECTVSSIKNENNEITHIIGSLRNITESLGRETELRKQKDFVALALRAGDLTVWMYEIAARTFSSLEGDTLSGTGLTMEQNLEILHPEDRVVFLENFDALINGRIPSLKMNLRYKAENSEESGYGHFESCMIPIRDEQGRITHITGTQKEVTNEYLRQQELSQSKLKTDLAIQTAGIVLWEFDNASGLFTCYNEPINGYNENQKLIADDYVNITHPDDKESIKEKLNCIYAGKDESFSFDLRIQYPGNSEWQYCTISGSPFKKDEHGRVVQYVGFRKNNTELQKKKTLLNNVLNHVPIPIHIKDVENDYRYIFWNEESKKLFGDAAFKSAKEILGEEEAERIHKIDRQVLESNKPYYGQEKIRTLDGRELETVVRKSVINNGDKKQVLTVRWDVSLQNELQRKSKILSTSMEALNAFTWYCDTRDGELIFSDGFEKTGGNRLQLNSMEKFAQQIHPDDRERFICFMNEFMKKEKGEFAIEYKIDFANTGNYEWWECRGMMESINKNGASFRHVYGMDINIEAHKKSEQVLLQNKVELANLIKQNELVLNNTNSGLAYISSDYIVQWENVSVCSASLSYEAYKRGEFCYKSAHNRNTPCDNCVMQRALNSRQTERIVFDFDNGKSIEVFATPVLSEGGEIDGVVIRVDDITERKQMISALQQAKVQAEQSDKLKSAFLANMSHEIRTPLNAIVGFSELLTEAISPEEKTEYSKIIATNNELLLKLINDILDLSKIEAGIMDLKSQEFDLAEFFDEIATSLQPRVTNPDIAFICHNPYQSCLVELDKNRLTQVLTNYVTNSIKYTVSGFIEMGYEYVNNGVRLYVKDSGIGISDDKKHKVFKRFEKLDEFAQGTGLGLSICRAITETLGGEVGFESKEGEGSTFWSWAPCRATICEKKPTDGESGSSLETDTHIETNKNEMHMKKILIAEDIDSNYLLMSALLRKNYDLTRALNGAEAIDKIKSESFDLVFMDMKMPVMDGLEATKKIREFNQEIAIIALTAHAFESDKEAALQSGCNDYLVKPINRTSLFETIEKYT